MSDFPSKNCEDPAELPVNERSSAFIDGVAFLDFVRLKSLVAPTADSAAKTGAPDAPAGQAVTQSFNGPDDIMENLQTTSRIGVEDWDFLFGAVEARLRETAEKLGVALAPMDAPNRASHTKAVVLDCVNALDQLHMALQQERRAHAAGRTHATTSDSAVASPLTNRRDPSQNN